MTRPRHIPDVADRTWDEMPSAYRGAERLEAFVRAQASAIQAIEDIGADLQYSTSWDVAEDAALDQWGRVVGRPRTALPDRMYRHLIRGQILASHSAGTEGELVDIYETVTDAREVRIWTHPNAGARLEALRLDWLPDQWARVVSRVMGVATPSGTRLQLMEYTPETIQLTDGDPDLDDQSLLSREI